MRRSAMLLVLLLASLYWLEPWLRRSAAADVPAISWLPAISHDTWNIVFIAIVVLTVAVALVLLARLGLFIWRELGD